MAHSIKTAIIGRGNVASHLAAALSLSDEVAVSTVNPHTLENLPEECDIILISVADQALPEVTRHLAARLPGYKGVVAHTAGSIDISRVSSLFPHAGVFYPLQTFTKDVPLDYRRIPIFVEASDPQTLASLNRLAHIVSDHVEEADSCRRASLHVAAVFACNFTNHLYGLAFEILEDAGIRPDALIPLIEQTTAKLHHTSPRDAQTGPARRKDMNVIASHLDYLSQNMPDRPEMGEIYHCLTKSILSNCEEQSDQNRNNE